MNHRPCANWRLTAGALTLLPLLLVAGLPAQRQGGPPKSTVGAPAVRAPSRQATERETLLRFCLQNDSTSPNTVEGVRLRTDCWKRMQLQGMTDSLVDARYQAALDDFVAAVRSDSSRAANDSSAGATKGRLDAIQRALQEGRLADANRLTDEVLNLQPDNQRALAFHDRIVALLRTRRLRLILFSVAGGILLLGVGLTVTARVLAGRHARATQERRTQEAQRRAVLEIVDGVGRGKLYNIDGPIFRIGSAVSERPEERNDLVLSDEGAFISRYHCSIVKKDGRYFLIDSSLNGTYVGDELMERGEHRPLEDGSEFSIAGMARFKFLLM